MESTIDRDELSRFVRQSLGCSCPDGVFDRVDVSPETDGSPIQMIIGGRLLLRVYNVDAGDGKIESRLAKWVEDGVRARDANGCNRFRLVLAARFPEDISARAQAALGRMPLADERVHVHTVGRSELDFALGGAEFDTVR